MQSNLASLRLKSPRNTFRELPNHLHRRLHEARVFARMRGIYELVPARLSWRHINANIADAIAEAPQPSRRLTSRRGRSEPHLDMAQNLESHGRAAL
jgi:hypothetical protein